jgi:hypothetical protein
MTIRSLLVFAASSLGMLAVSGVHAQDPRYGGGPGYGGGEVVECQSNNYNLQRCRVPWRDARLVRQISSTPCRRGQNWGVDRQGLWVNGGCAGQFADAARGGGWRPGADWDRRFSISCSSNNYQYTFCAVDLGGGGRARIERQTSNSACIEGRTWGWNRAGIWTNQGCAGVFSIDRRWH